MAGKLNQFGTIQERIAGRYSVDPGGCWIWHGAVSNGRYGSIFYQGRMQKAHRVAWILVNGPVPENRDLDHLCRNTRCINPDHLEPVSRSENLRRSPLMDRHSMRTHCIRGHEFTSENTRRRSNGHRVCKECMRMHIRNWRSRNAISS